MQHALHWFEIPVVDLDRACKFYEKVLGARFKVETLSGRPLAIFPFDQDGVGGALVKDEGRSPSKDGSLVYLNAGKDLDGCLERIEAAGGRVVMPKTDIGAPGFIAMFEDSEGNCVALHTPR